MKNTTNPNEPEQHSEEHLPVFDDDVTEADNPIPRWWLAFFFTMIAVAVFYFGYYQIFAVGYSLEDELRIDVQQAKIEQDIRDRELQAKMESTMAPEAIGKKYFKTFCASCHGAEGEGNIGPNFHDNSWIHEPTQASLINVVTNGVAAKGMPTWGPILGDKKIKSLIAYVMSLRNETLTVAGKAPEGNVYSKEQLEALMTGKAVEMATNTSPSRDKPAAEKAKSTSKPKGKKGKK